jgi:hypothetical protein
MKPIPRAHRLAYAAAHVAMRASYRALQRTAQNPSAPAEILEHLDWEATLGIRRHLAAHGLGVAEAMDTAQRFEIGWPVAKELITRCGALQLARGFCAGAGTDQRATVRGPADLVDAVVEQCVFIAAQGGVPVILPMPWLSVNRAEPAVYLEVYGAIFRQVRGPVIVHWLGPMFLPTLAGYFPGDSFSQVMALEPTKARACKLSLLDAALEVRIRRELLPRDQFVLTGDDFHFARLILGGDAAAQVPASALPPPVARWTEFAGQLVALGDFSHALLGILDAIAAPASRAFTALTRNDATEFLRHMQPCEELGQWLFQAPTSSYKAGLAYLAHQNGLQFEFLLPNGAETLRVPSHYQRAAEIARAVGALPR